jgi:methyl-accepting chemotaxis protein
MSPNVEKAADLMAQATRAAIEQDAGIKQVNMGLEQLNLLTQQNSSSAGELANLSEKLFSQSQKLIEILKS